MNAYKWIVCGVIAAGSLATIANVGKPKTPTTPGAACFIVTINAVIAWMVTQA